MRGLKRLFSMFEGLSGQINRAIEEEVEDMLKDIPADAEKTVTVTEEKVNGVTVKVTRTTTVHRTTVLSEKVRSK